MAEPDLTKLRERPPSLATRLLPPIREDIERHRRLNKALDAAPDREKIAKNMRTCTSRWLRRHSEAAPEETNQSGPCTYIHRTIERSTASIRWMTHERDCGKEPLNTWLIAHARREGTAAESPTCTCGPRSASRKSAHISPSAPPRLRAMPTAFLICDR